MHLVPADPRDPRCDLYLTGIAERPPMRLGEPIYIERDGLHWVVRDSMTGVLLKYTAAMMPQEVKA